MNQRSYREILHISIIENHQGFQIGTQGTDERWGHRRRRAAGWASQARLASSAAAGVRRAGTRPPQPDRFLRFPPDISAHTGSGVNGGGCGGAGGEEAAPMNPAFQLCGCCSWEGSRFFGGEEDAAAAVTPGFQLSGCSGGEGSRFFGGSRGGGGGGRYCFFGGSSGSGGAAFSSLR